MSRQLYPDGVKALAQKGKKKYQEDTPPVLVLHSCVKRHVMA